MCNERLPTLARLINALRFVVNRKSLKNFVQVSETSKGFDSSFKVSWSQGAEDLVLLSLLSYLEPGSCVDIGAHHPSRYSNTRHLYQLGWRGVNIDADQDLLPEFFSHRPDDINICAAVGSQNSYILNVFDEKLVSTVNSQKANFEESIGRKKLGEREVRGITLRSVLDQYFPEDKVSLLLIDIEGSDYDALESIDFDTLDSLRFPEYLVLETSPPLENALNTPAVKLAVSKGYEVLYVLPLSTILKAPTPN